MMTYDEAREFIESRRPAFRAMMQLGVPSPIPIYEQRFNEFYNALQTYCPEVYEGFHPSSFQFEGYEVVRQMPPFEEWER
jgi:hypothetical protein